ncbi:MAG: hypothetical protein U9Q92_06310 [archaeon]|nr:hypothetical protein [archaeon]
MPIPEIRRITIEDIGAEIVNSWIRGALEGYQQKYIGHLKWCHSVGMEPLRPEDCLLLQYIYTGPVDVEEDSRKIVELVARDRPHGSSGANYVPTCMKAIEEYYGLRDLTSGECMSTVNLRPVFEAVDKLYIEAGDRLPN